MISLFCNDFDLLMLQCEVPRFCFSHQLRSLAQPETFIYSTIVSSVTLHNGEISTMYHMYLHHNTVPG